MRPVILTPMARQELMNARDWYEREVPGLGRNFRVAVESVVERIATNPGQFPVVYKNIRRALLRRYP